MENKIKENTKLEILLIAAVLIAFTAPAATPVVLVAAPVTTAAAFIAPVTALIALVVTLASTGIAISALLN